MAYTTDDSIYATTVTGEALSQSSVEIKNIAGPITRTTTVNQIGAYEFDTYNTYANALPRGKLRHGLALSDFDSSLNPAFFGTISFVFTQRTLDTAALLGAVWEATGGTGAAGAYPEDWNSGQSTLIGDLECYYNGSDVFVYKCIDDDGGGFSSIIPPPDDPDHWELYSKQFYLRLIPAEDSIQPGLQGADRFFHYAKIYPVFTSSEAPGPIDEYFNMSVAGPDYINMNSAFFAIEGRQNSVVVDASPDSSTTLGVTGASISISGSTVTATHGNTTFERFVVGSKVRIRQDIGAGLMLPLSATIDTVSLTGFTATILTTGTFSATVAYDYLDFVTYTPPAGSLGVYYVSNDTSAVPVGTLPSNATHWTKVTTFGGGCIVDPIIKGWNFYLETDFFEQEMIPIPAGSNSSSNANARNEVNLYEYKEEIINQKQVLFYTGDYIVHEGFPFDKDSITGATINITAGVVPNSISPVTRPIYTTTNASDLPLSDNRWIPDNTDFSAFTFPANANYNWASNNGATTRNLTVFNNATNTYLPDLLVGNATYNPRAISNKLNLATPDASIPPLTPVDSVSFSNNQLMFQTFNPYRIDGANNNDFTTFMVLFPDYVPGGLINTTYASNETNWYGIMSQARQTNVLATDIGIWKNYTQSAPRLSVRFKLNGTILLNLGDRTLTAISTRNGVSRPFQPMIIGLTISAADNSATLTVVDEEINRSTVSYTKNWLGFTPETHNTMLYGAVPYSNRLNSSKMYVLEINHYYGTQTEQFFNTEIQKMDKMYAVTSGRV
jgi:hypothetical protein